MINEVPSIDLNAPLGVENSEVFQENETVVKSLNWFYGGSAVLVIFILITLLIGHFALRPTQTVPQIVEIPSPTPVVVQKAKLDRSTLVVEVLNGSGKSGKAAEVAKSLEKLGYKVGKIGNADKRYDVTVALISSASAQFAPEILSDLGVTTQSFLDEAGVDIRLILGLDAL